jgi:nucleotide-binding universal stress UspA family protein
MYQHILAAIDGSETSARAFEAAVRLARKCGAELQPLYVIDVPVMAYDATGYDPGCVRDALMEEGKKWSTRRARERERAPRSETLRLRPVSTRRFRLPLTESSDA